MFVEPLKIETPESSEEEFPVAFAVRDYEDRIINQKGEKL